MKPVKRSLHILKIQFSVPMYTFKVNIYTTKDVIFMFKKILFVIIIVVVRKIAGFTVIYILKHLLHHNILGIRYSNHRWIMLLVYVHHFLLFLLKWNSFYRGMSGNTAINI